MKRILVGIDTSSEARSAAVFASKLAAASGANLVLASVAAAVDPFVSPELQSRSQVFVDAEKAELTESLETLADELRRPGLAVETVLESGDPAAVLAELATRLDVELVVVGHRGRGAVKRLLLGSTADRLVQICSKPVTVVR